MYCHSLPVGHGMRHDWFVWPAKDCHSLAVGHWMSPPARKKKHGYSLPIGHEMRHDGWVWLAKKLLLTGYWSWDETCVCLPKKKKSRATHCLLFMRYDYLIRLSAMKKCSVTHCLMEEHYMISKSAWKKKKKCHSHPMAMGWKMIDRTTCQNKCSHSPTFGHGMRHNWWDYLLNKNECHSPTVWHNWWDHFPKKINTVAYMLLVMGWDKSGKEELWYHSPAVGHGIKWLVRLPCNKMSFTLCWSWDERFGSMSGK